MEPTFPSILHLLAYNGYEDEAYKGAMVCRETWSDPRVFCPKLLNRKLGLQQMTLLGILACHPRTFPRIRQLVAWGAKVDIPNMNGFTPLQSVAVSAHVQKELFTFLLDHGANPNGAPGRTNPMTILAMNNSIDQMQELLDRGADINIRSSNGYTPLLNVCTSFVHQWVPQIKDETIHFLCQNGADIHAKDESGHTALQICLYKNEPRYARILLQYGAEIPRYGMWAAIDSLHKETIQFFISHGMPLPEDALLVAIENNTPDEVKVLLECGACPNKPLYGKPPLFQAALCLRSDASIQILHHLCDAGANVHSLSIFDSLTPEPILYGLVRQYIRGRNPYVLEGIKYLHSRGAQSPPKSICKTKSYCFSQTDASQDLAPIFA